MNCLEFALLLSALLVLAVIAGSIHYFIDKLRRYNDNRPKLQLIKIDPVQLKQMENLNSRMEQLNSEAKRDEAADPSVPLVKAKHRRKRKPRRGNRNVRKN